MKTNSVYLTLEQWDLVQRVLQATPSVDPVFIEAVSTLQVQISRHKNHPALLNAKEALAAEMSEREMGIS